MASVTVPASGRGLLRRPTAITGFWSWFTTVDHKKIGIMYGVSAFVFFLVGGLEALLIRSPARAARRTLLNADQYNQIFTMHGVTMVFLFVMPMSAAFFNYLIPLMIGARDVAFPRLNAYSFWVFILGGALPVLELLPGRRAERRLVRVRAELHDRPDDRHDLLRDRAADHGHRLDDRRGEPGA